MNKGLQLTLECIQEVMKRNKRQEVPLTPSLDILKDTSLDSLDLAEVIVLLEEKTGKDPFLNGFINFKTIGELAKLYE